MAIEKYYKREPLYIDPSLITIDNPNFPFKMTGGNSDLFLGSHTQLGRIALKRLRLATDDGRVVITEDQERRFLREGHIWQQLQHEHILQFLGVYRPESTMIYLVSPFERNGSLRVYVERNPEADIVRLLYQTALAIQYLHEQDLLHGDVKGDNILVSAKGTALLADLGLARLVEDYTSVGQRGAGSLRWQSPEVMMGGRRSKASDVYAFGLTIAEILNGQVPFNDLASGNVLYTVCVRDQRPNPDHQRRCEHSDLLWSVAELAWIRRAGSRPPISAISEYLNPRGDYVQGILTPPKPSAAKRLFFFFEP